MSGDRDVGSDGTVPCCHLSELNGAGLPLHPLVGKTWEIVGMTWGVRILKCFVKIEGATIAPKKWSN